jgi:AraC family ethanolamine operon transcriptional activator
LKGICLAVINLSSLSPSPLLSTSRCADPEMVANMLPGIKRRLLPLAGDFECLQASLQLGCLSVVLVKRPPCASEAYLDQSQVGLALAMDESPGLKLDGLPLDRSAVVTHGLTTPHRIFQPSELTIAAILLPETTIRQRGWPERDRPARVDSIKPEIFQHLRSIIRDVVCAASDAPSRFSRESLVTGMQQSLLGTIDHAFFTSAQDRSTRLAVGNHARICRAADAFIVANSGGTPSSADVAAAAGVTIRTLHNAMVAVHGMSLQRYMILNRLWAARAALGRGGPQSLVKTIAFDQGFWHLGRFSRTYRAFFGECPSDTLKHRTSVQLPRRF